ncbi:hypothetical protein ACM66B_000505 [Microbotryomycetes sp. NB124-2]
MAAVIDGSTATVTYNNGLWTPDDELLTPTLTTPALAESTSLGELELTSLSTSTTTPALAVVTTTPAAQVAASSTATPPAVSSTTQPAAQPPTSSSSSTSAAVSATPQAAATSASLDEPEQDPVSETSQSIAFSSQAASSSAAAATAATGSLASSAKHNDVDMKLLIPAFVIGPIVIVAMILALTYGRCWGKRHYRDNFDRRSRFWFGSRGRSTRRPRKDMFADEDDEDGFVESKFVASRYASGGGGGEYDDDADLDPWDEKAAMGPYAQNVPQYLQRQPTESRWAQLKRGISNASRFGRAKSQRRPRTDETPFAPPSRSSVYNLPSVDVRPNTPQWTYGVAPEPTIAEEGSNTFLTAGGAWTWGRNNTKYRAKSQSSSRQSSIRSRLSDRWLSRNANEIVPPSPSIYSPNLRSSDAYAGLDGEDIDEEPDNEALNAYLGESRVGDDALASRFLGGETELAYAPRDASTAATGNREDEFRARDDYRQRHEAAKRNSTTMYDDLVQQMGMTMPTPPRFTQSSPTKASAGASLLRHAGAVDSPGNRPGTIFQYDSPPVRSTYQPAPMITFSPERQQQPAPSSPRPPLPQPPQPRQPIFASAYRDAQPPTQPTDVFASKPLPVPRAQQLVQQESTSYPQDTLQSLDGSVVFGGENTDEFARREQRREAAVVSDARRPSIGGDKARPVVPPRHPMRRITPPSTPSGEVFDPVFDDAPPLPLLEHPSRVRNAIFNLEARVKQEEVESSLLVSPRVRQRQAHSRSRSEDSAAQRVSGGKTLYQRPTKSSQDDNDDNDDDCQDNIDNVRETRKREKQDDERISKLLERRRTADWSGSDVQGYSSQEADTSHKKARPLSSDSKRLSAMLRRPSSGANRVAME